MKKIFVLIASLFLFSCVPKSTLESEALLEEIHSTKSKTKVGINYRDYSKVVQDLQVKLDNFERSENSKKLKYAGSLKATAKSYINAKNKERGEDWSPQLDWENAALSHTYTHNCQTKNENCYDYDEARSVSMDILEQRIDGLIERTKELEKKPLSSERSQPLKTNSNRSEKLDSKKVKVTCPDYAYGILVSSDRKVDTIHVKQLTVTKAESENTKYYCVYWFGNKSEADITVE